MKRAPAILAVLLVVAALLRVPLLIGTPSAQFLEIDGRDYQDISKNLEAGEGFSISYYRWFEPRPEGAADRHPDLHRPPLLPLLGAALYFLPGEWEFWAKALSLAIGLLAVALVFLLTKQFFGAETGLVATALLAVYPSAIYYTARWSTENLFLVCTLAGILVIAIHRREPRPSLALAAGILLGLAALARSTGLLTLCVLVAYLALRARETRRTASVVLILAGAVIPLVPWSIRNFQQTGVFNPATFFGPYNMWLGMNRQMYEMYRSGESPGFRQAMDALYQVESKEHVRRLESNAIHDPVACNRYWLATTREFMAAHPDQTAFIVLHRGLHFLRPWPNRATVPKTVVLVSALSVLPLMALALHSLAVRLSARDGLLLLPMLSVFLASLPFIFHLRFRYPVFEPLLIVLASPGAFQALSWVARRIRTRLRQTNGG